MSGFCKVPCKYCPYRTDVKPFLTMARAVELAYAPQNPYNTFACHKTLGEDEEGDTMEIETSLECAGFLTMRAQAGEEVPEGFEPSYELCYIDDYDMIQAYEEAGVR